MPKLALCIPVSELGELEVEHNADIETSFFTSLDVFKKKSVLLDRADCETDLNHLQIIPYVVLIDKDSLTDPTQLDPKLFIYQRGQASGEGRLTGKCSIGLGGHIETLPEGNLLEHVIRDAMRELEEEVGIVPTDELGHDILNCFHNSQVKEDEGDGFVLIFNARAQDVDKVHLACAIFLPINRDLLGKNEHGVIESGRWMALSEINSYVRETFDAGKLNEPDLANKQIVLETWSFICTMMLSHIVEGAVRQPDEHETAVDELQS